MVREMQEFRLVFSMGASRFLELRELPNIVTGSRLITHGNKFFHKLCPTHWLFLGSYGPAVLLQGTLFQV